MAFNLMFMICPHYGGQLYFFNENNATLLQLAECVQLCLLGLHNSGQGLSANVQILHFYQLEHRDHFIFVGLKTKN